MSIYGNSVLSKPLLYTLDINVGDEVFVNFTKVLVLFRPNKPV